MDEGGSFNELITFTTTSQLGEIDTAERERIINDFQN